MGHKIFRMERLETYLKHWDTVWDISVSPSQVIASDE